MPEPRARLVIGVRTIVGVIGVVVGVGVVAAATFVPLPMARLDPAAVTVTPVPSAQQLICPGAVLRLGDESGANATDATAVGSPSSSRGATAGEVETRPLAATDAGGGLGAPVVLSLPSDPRAGIAGAQSQSVDLSDYRGFAAAECSAPSSDTWLLGGSTAVGRTTLLTVANPGAVSSTVTLDIFGEDGRVEAPGTSGIVVAAGSQRVLSLAGFAPSLESLAVHVTSRGGPVVANLQQSVVRGIDPGGIDIIGATTAPATEHVIPGVILANTIDVQGLVAREGYDDLTTVLRILVPGETAAEVTVRVTPLEPDGKGASFDLTVDAGVVTDVPVDELEDGTYSVEVDADVPIVAALRASTATGEEADLSWFTAADELRGDALIAVANGPASTLSLTNPSSAAITATLDGRSIEVAPGAMVSVEIADSSTHVLANASGLYASVGYVGRGALGSFVVSASATEEPPVTVYP